jgi:hypothetical protein
MQTKIYDRVKSSDKITKIKELIKNFKYRPEDPHRGLKYFERFATSRHIFFAKTLNWMEEKSLSRKIIAWIFNLSVWIFALKSLIMYFRNDEFTSFLFGDFTYLIDKRDILELMLSILYLGMAFAGLFKYDLIIFIKLYRKYIIKNFIEFFKTRFKSK